MPTGVIAPSSSSQQPAIKSMQQTTTTTTTTVQQTPQTVQHEQHIQMSQTKVFYCIFALPHPILKQTKKK